jgi:hypothetical protein
MIKTRLDHIIEQEIYEVEHHLHNRERWFGAAASPSGETHVADRMDGAILAFQLTAGNNDFGSWVQILGSSDTPIVSTMTKFDGHRFMVTSTNSTSPYVFHVITGESSGFAAKLADNEYMEVPYISATNNNDSGISDVISIRVDAGAKVWARCACVGQNGTTIDIYFGIHEYLR